MSESYLAHHGILGMKWGVRRTPEQLGYKRVSAKNKSSQSKPKVETETQKRSIHDMSDEELRRRINRLQMEKQYKDLTRKELTAGQKWVNSVLNDTTKKIASNYLTKLATNALDSLMATQPNAKKESQQKKK